MQSPVSEGALRRTLHALHRHPGDLAVALDEPFRRATLELNVDELRGDLGGGVEAQRKGADEIGFAFLQLFLIEAVQRYVPYFRRGDVERFARALVLGCRAAIKIG